MKDIKEIIDMGRKLDELTYEVYMLFIKRDDFDRRLVQLWTELAEWKKLHIKQWKKVSRSFVYKNLFGRSDEDIKTIIKQLKNMQAELVEFLRRLRKKKVTQQEAISQTILNEFCLVSDIFLEIFYTYGESCGESAVNMIDECQAHLGRMATVLKPYLKMNPLYAVLIRSMVDIKQKYDFLLRTEGKQRLAAG